MTYTVSGGTLNPSHSLAHSAGDRTFFIINCFRVLPFHILCNR